MCPLKPKLEGLAIAQEQQTLKEKSMVLEGGQVPKGAEVEMMANVLTRGLNRFTEGHHGHGLQNGDEQGLHFLDETVPGIKVESLVDKGVTHSFVSE